MRAGVVALTAPTGALRFSHQAMATVFEIICTHADPAYARQAAWAAFDLLDRLEQELSRFLENSDLSRIHHLAPGESVRVNRWTMECLQLARLGYAETEGAFDISLGSGIDRLQLDPQHQMVRANAGGVRLDLGGIGKGYAVDRMAEVLMEWGVEQAVIHGGFSSALALEAPGGSEGWPLTMSVHDAPFTLLQARQRAFSASGTQKGDHIVDPAHRATGTGPAGGMGFRRRERPRGVLPECGHHNWLRYQPLSGRGGGNLLDGFSGSGCPCHRELLPEASRPGSVDCGSNRWNARDHALSGPDHPMMGIKMKPYWLLSVAAILALPAALPAQPKLEPVPIVLPKPGYEGTPPNFLNIPNMERPSVKDRAPFLAPAGVTNVAKGKKVTSSEKEPVVGDFAMVHRRRRCPD